MIPLTADTSSRALSGRLRLRFTESHGKTVVSTAERTPPLHIQRALYLDPARPGLARVALLNSTAGLFAGDRLTVALQVDGGAEVEVVTPQMTRAFAMPSGQAETCTTMTVADGGYLEYLPEPLLLCRDATVLANLSLNVTAGATVAAGEVVAFGRVGRGERYAFREYVSSVIIHRRGETLAAERLDVQPASTDVTALLGGYAAYGSLYLLGNEARPLLTAARKRLAATPDLLGGASALLGDAGVVVRVLGSAATTVQATLRAIINDFRAATPL